MAVQNYQEVMAIEDAGNVAWHVDVTDQDAVMAGVMTAGATGAQYATKTSQTMRLISLGELSYLFVIAQRATRELAKLGVFE